ncbi:glycosyl transferase family protein [Neptunomonas antarctica]|uniref:Anthranilate phosphoribosyltransferase n=1 Tax=Neptunomonas antarctica TaxID=619304 RepID=A0A1N7JVC2_9GAMM|nr:glycosyl transferase family protein [Neptunomonas antarctica]SIS53283.1 Anthranilate phosphoribosyltransferase [Neptunomonas antarctica]
MAEHAFAPYVRILGKGKKGSRSLTQQESFDAMSMILSGSVRAEQLGAFLMLLRVKEESPEELAGFVQAARLHAHAPEQLKVDLDWSTYAGKKRQLPWFLLAALVLSENNIRVLMHGSKGHTEGRLYIEDMLSLFGFGPALDWQQVAANLDSHGFAYISIDDMVPRLGDIIQLRPILGLRSPVHTLCRLINPLGAPCTVDGVFHPAYAPMHQKTSLLLGVQQGLTIRGDGGEAELKPDSDCEVRWIRQGELSDEQWMRILPKRLVKEEVLDPSMLIACWRGDVAHEYGEAAIISTLAALLVLLDKADHQASALILARELWQKRDRSRF